MCARRLGGSGLLLCGRGGAGGVSIHTNHVFSDISIGVWNWFHTLEAYLGTLPDLEVREDGEAWKESLRKARTIGDEELLVPAAAEQLESLDVQRGLSVGALVSIAPDDTGRDHPTVGELVKMGVEEVVIRPLESKELDVRVHFPRLGFVVKVVEGSRL